MLQKKISDIILKLKKVREEEGITYARIVQLVEENGGSVSLNTVKKVFEEGSEEYGFQYENTLKPIAEAVLGIYSPSVNVTDDEADAMKAIIDYKSDIVTELRAQLEKMYEDRRTILEKQIAQLQDEVELLKNQIEKKDQMFDRLMTAFVLREKEKE